MLTVKYRLRTTRDINRVYSKGRYAAVDAVVVKAISNNLSYSRLVVVVSKKVSKKAVIRNRIRRHIVEYVRMQWETVTPGYDIVVTVRHDAKHEDIAQLGSSTNAALKRLQLI